MFRLSDDDLKREIVACGDGPASFNVEMTQQIHRVISCDPLYQFAAGEIRQRIDATWPSMVEFAQKNHSDFNWDTIRSPAELGRVRRQAMELFLKDFERGRREGRYLVAALPHLPFEDGAFGLALCSHLLFLYSQEFSETFHLDALVEMMRVASEVRVFPLIDRTGQRSVHLDHILGQLEQKGWAWNIETVDYEFQRGGDQMLRILGTKSRGRVQ